MSGTVLVTAIGTVTATVIVRELKAAGGFHVIGADVNKGNEVATSLDVDEFYEFPYASDEAYVPFVLEFCKTHSVDYYYAVLDVEVVAVTARRADFEAGGTKLCMVDHEFARACHYKDTFGYWVAKNVPDVAVVQYSSMDEALAARFPLFVKPIEGVASAGCKRVDTPDELKAALRPEQVGTQYLVQEFVEGSNVTVDCLRNRASGQKAQAQRRELLRNANGCGIAVEIIDDRELEDICDRLMELLDLNGVVNIEFFDTGSGYRIIEINPRFSAGTEYTCMAGINTVLEAMRIADGERCVLGELTVGAHFAERYEAYRTA